MKVKDLKAILANCDDDATLWVSDVDSACIEVISANVTGQIVYLDVRHEFPEAWFENGLEVRYVAGCRVGIYSGEPTHDTFLLGPNEKETKLVFHDGFALREEDGVKMLEYPKLMDLTDEQIEDLDEALGGRISDSGTLTYEDAASVLGKVLVEEEPEKKEARFQLSRDMHLLCETIQEITLHVWDKVWADNKYDQDSRNVLEMLRDWGVEFENYWQEQFAKDEYYGDTHDYLEEVWAYADKKADEYVKEIEG